MAQSIHTTSYYQAHIALHVSGDDESTRIVLSLSHDTSTDAYHALIGGVERVCTSGIYTNWDTFEAAITRETYRERTGETVATHEVLRTVGSIDADEYVSAWGEGYAAARQQHNDNATYAIGYVAGRFAAIDDTDSEVAA